MKKILILFITIFVTMISTPCFADANFILDLKPGSILFSPDIDGFRVSVALQVLFIIQIQSAEADHGCPL